MSLLGDTRSIFICYAGEVPIGVHRFELVSFTETDYGSGGRKVTDSMGGPWAVLKVITGGTDACRAERQAFLQKKSDNLSR